VKRLFAMAPLLALLGLGAGELTAHARAVAAVAPLSDWQRAASFVRSELRPKDLITSAPGYTDPRLREVLGDAIGLAMAGRSDLAAYERLWVLSVDGRRAPEAAGKTAVLQRAFGGVTVSRYALGKSTLTFDLTSAVAAADVSTGPREAPAPCALRKLHAPRGGGLGLGTLPPASRFVCDGGGWVAPVVQEDLANTPRYCVRQGTSLRTPVRATLHDVPLGERLVIHYGLYYEDERMRRGAPFELRVYVDDHELGRAVHRDGDGWKRTAWLMPTGKRGTTGDVTIETRTRSRNERSVCWAASTRATPAERAP